MNAQVRQELTGTVDSPPSLEVPLHPAIILAISSCIALGLRSLAPFPLGFPTDLHQAVEGGSLAAAIGLIAWCLWTFSRTKTSPEYGQEVRTLLTSGPYRFSRNPLFIANALLFATVALELDNVWALAVLPLHVLALDRLVIAREERFLAARFGDSYADYCGRVRRWL